MQTDAVMTRLEQLGTAANRALFARHGVRLGMFGVSYHDIAAIARGIRVDHDLAVALWRTGNYDARMLASKIADPDAIRLERIEAWSRELDNHLLADAFADLVCRTPFATGRINAWTASDDCWQCRAGWMLLTHCAAHDPSLTDEFFFGMLGRYEACIATVPGRAADAMKRALVSIGQRNPRLHRAAVETAHRTGRAAGAAIAADGAS